MLSFIIIQFFRFRIRNIAQKYPIFKILLVHACRNSHTQRQLPIALPPLQALEGLCSVVDKGYS